MPIGAAILGAGAIGAGAQIYGAQKAAGTQTQLGQAALAQQKAMFDIAQGNAQPFINFSRGVMPQLADLLTPGKSADALAQLPGYQFSLAQGQRAVTNALSAMGLGTSGPLARGLDQYTQGFAQNTFFPYLGAMQNAVNTGAGAAGTLGGQAVATGQGMGNTLSGIGNAQAAAMMSGASAIGSLAGSVPNALLLSKLLGGGGGGGAQSALDTLTTNYPGQYQSVDLGSQLGGQWNPFTEAALL
jgi:hypothetical protein